MNNIAILMLFGFIYLLNLQNFKICIFKLNGGDFDAQDLLEISFSCTLWGLKTR